MIYLDNAATSRPLSLALEAFVKASQKDFANSSSPHFAGNDAYRLLESSRRKILQAAGVEKTHSLIFTSGATEANNLALKGVAFSYQKRGKRIVSSLTEHASVLSALEELRDSFGFSLTLLPCNANGVVEPETLEKAMGPDVILVSLMAVNNEMGAINDVKAFSSIVHAYPKAFFHVDATQAIGKENIDFSCADLISFSAHKFGGLKGNGALLYKRGIRFLPLNSGGDQEHGFRSGTVDVAGAYAMEEAFSYALARQAENRKKAVELRALLLDGLSSMKEFVSLNGDPAFSSPFITSFALLKHKASVVVEALSEKGICVSSHSACNMVEKPTKTLLAMGISPESAANSIRVSFGMDSTKEDVEGLLSALNEIFQEVHVR